jgi:hypothetical protein
MNRVADRWALQNVLDGRIERDEAGNLITVDCSFHGRNVPEPRHADMHHTSQCPTERHCPMCFHGTYAVVSCDCPRVEDVAAYIDLMFQRAS